MNQDERLDYIVEALKEDSDEYKKMEVSRNERRSVMRSLMNIRMPEPIASDFINIQDQFLQEEANLMIVHIRKKLALSFWHRIVVFVLRYQMP